VWEVLDRIIESKRMRLEKEKLKMPLELLRTSVENSTSEFSDSFSESIRKDGDLAIIGEIKKASPSKGIIRADFDPAQLAKAYDKAAVSAISVLTETDFFMGDDSYIDLVRQSCQLPILRKDFIIDIWQIYQTKMLKASAVLLIAAILSKSELKNFYETAKKLGIDCLVEVHNRSELEVAVEIGAQIIGINNRDLKTFRVDIKTTEELVKHIPANVTVVSESGIDKTNVRHVKDLGVNAILVGETFMRQTDVCEAVIELRRCYA
jgi:indole-3-glycerol phosphate synthase